jgi:hypothetical protein
MADLGLEGTLNLLGKFLTDGVVLRYERGKLRPWPQASVTPEIKALIRKHRAELRALLATPLGRFEHYAWAVRRRYYHSHGITGLDAFELVGSHAFSFANGGVREYYLMERQYRPPN